MLEDSLYVAYGALTVQNGGQVFSSQGWIGQRPGPAGETGGDGTVTVDGVGSAWTMSNQLVIAAGAGDTGALSVQNGGVVSSVRGVVGYDTGSDGAVTVDGSTWTNSGELTVGYPEHTRLRSSPYTFLICLKIFLKPPL